MTSARPRSRSKTKELERDGARRARGSLEDTSLMVWDPRGEERNRRQGVVVSYCADVDQACGCSQALARARRGLRRVFGVGRDRGARGDGRLGAHDAVAAE